MMSIWGFIALIGGIGIGIAILANILGVTNALNVVVNFFGHFFATIRDLLNTLTHAAPPFIRVCIFIALFWAFGALLFSNTVGLAYVCDTSNGDLYYTANIPTIFMYYMYPENQPFAVGVPSNDPYNISTYRGDINPFTKFGRKTKDSTNAIFMGGTQTGELESYCSREACSEDVGMHYFVPVDADLFSIDTAVLPAGGRWGYWPGYVMYICAETKYGSCYASDVKCSDHKYKDGSKISTGYAIYRFKYFIDDTDKIFHHQIKPVFEPSKQKDLRLCPELSESRAYDIYTQSNNYPLKIDLEADSSGDYPATSGYVYEANGNAIGSQAEQDRLTVESSMYARDAFLQESGEFKMVGTISDQESSTEVFKFTCEKDTSEDANENRPYKDTESFSIFGIPIFKFEIIAIIIGLIAFLAIIKFIKGK